MNISISEEKKILLLYSDAACLLYNAGQVTPKPKLSLLQNRDKTTKTVT